MLQNSISFNPFTFLGHFKLLIGATLSTGESQSLHFLRAFQVGKGFLLPCTLLARSQSLQFFRAFQVRRQGYEQLRAGQSRNPSAFSGHFKYNLFPADLVYSSQSLHFLRAFQAKQGFSGAVWKIESQSLHFFRAFQVKDGKTYHTAYV